RCLFPKPSIPGPKRSGVSFSPRFPHPFEIGSTSFGPSQGVTQKDFAIAVRQSADHRDMFVNRLESAYLFPHPFGALQKVIIQTMRSRDVAIAPRVDETLGAFQRCRIWSRQGVILSAERMDGAQKIEWGFCVSYAPNTTFRRSLRSVNRDCEEQHPEAEQNEGSPTAGLPLKKQKHFQHL